METFWKGTVSEEFRANGEITVFFAVVSTTETFAIKIKHYSSLVDLVTAHDNFKSLHYHKKFPLK